jgi:predicted ArsR family transcriptional regulator
MSPGPRHPKAALALVERIADLLGVAVTATDLEIAAAAYERQVSEVVADDEDMADYVERLEERFNSDEGATSASWAEEVERYLRERPPG